MSRIWRWITPVAVAGGLVAGVPAIPAATASTAAISITISATSPNYPGLLARDHGKVDGFAVVIYKATKNHVDTGVVGGTVTTSATNDKATLLAEPFGARHFTAVGRPVTLVPSNGRAGYSFNVKPARATHYKVKVSGADSAVSSVATVYVTAGVRIPKRSVHAHCSSTSPVKCRFSFRLYVTMPSSALRHEIGKHWYEYLGVGYPYPAVPRYVTLSRTATASKATKVNSGEFYRTFSYSFRVLHNSPNPDPVECVKDTESKDGMGLPGHHGCGVKRVSTKTLYLG
jgi:hypothetical protein